MQCLAHAIFGAATFRLLKSPGVHLLAQPPKVLHRAAFRLIRYNCPLAQRPGRADPAPVRTLNRHPPVFSDEEFGLRTREIGHTGHRGPCRNTYVREEELIRQFGELLKQIRIPTELAGTLATVLRESQTDKEKFVRTSMLACSSNRYCAPHSIVFTRTASVM